MMDDSGTDVELLAIELVFEAAAQEGGCHYICGSPELEFEPGNLRGHVEFLDVLATETVKERDDQGSHGDPQENELCKPISDAQKSH
jgi:hypothetical protein